MAPGNSEAWRVIGLALAPEDVARLLIGAVVPMVEERLRIQAGAALPGA